MRINSVEEFLKKYKNDKSVKKLNLVYYDSFLKSHDEYFLFLREENPFKLWRLHTQKNFINLFSIKAKEYKNYFNFNPKRKFKLPCLDNFRNLNLIFEDCPICKMENNEVWDIFYLKIARYKKFNFFDPSILVFKKYDQLLNFVKIIKNAGDVEYLIFNPVQKTLKLPKPQSIERARSIENELFDVEMIATRLSFIFTNVNKESLNIYFKLISEVVSSFSNSDKIVVPQSQEFNL